MLNQRKPKRFNYKSQHSLDNNEKKDHIKTEFEQLKRIPKKNTTKVSTMVVLIGLLFAVFIIMYFLESKMN